MLACLGATHRWRRCGAGPARPRFGRRKPERIAALNALRDASPQEALRALVRHAGYRGVESDQFALGWNLTHSDARAPQSSDKFRVVETAKAKRAFSLEDWRRYSDDALRALRRLGTRAASRAMKFSRLRMM